MELLILTESSNKCSYKRTWTTDVDYHCDRVKSETYANWNSSMNHFYSYL